MVTEDQHKIQLGNHEEWFRIGITFLDIADLVWVKVQEMFEASARIRSKRTRSAADVELLLDRLRFAGPFHVNAGYAIEDLLKAVRVKRLKREGKGVEQGRGPNRLPTRSHTYVDLARDELGTLTADEEQLLKDLTVFVTWGGRYPMAKRPEDVKPEGLGTSAADYTKIHRLVDRIIQKYESLR